MVLGLPQISTVPREPPYAEQRLEQFALAVALHAGDPEYFALAQIEVDIGQAMIDAKLAQAERDGIGRGLLAFGIEPVHAAAEHVGDDRLVVDSLRVIGGDRRCHCERR
jgi:hypothetical protein